MNQTANQAPRPATLRLEVSRSILITSAPHALADEVRQALTFTNPKWIENDHMGRWNGETPKTLQAYTEAPDGLRIPRGYGRQLLGIARRHGLEANIEDRTRTLPEASFDFKGTLKPFQEQAVKAVLGRPCGTLSAPTGSGKTVMALAIIAERRQPALIVVHTRELLNQWVDRTGAFLGIPAEEVGVIGDGKKTVGERITVSTVQSLYKCAEMIAPKIGHLIVDECHRTPSRTFTQAVSAFDARFLLGLSATPWRRDRLSKLIYWSLGDLAHKVEPGALQDAGDILRADVVWRETAFRTRFDPSEEYTRMLSELTRDPERNALIVEDVAREAAEDGAGVLLVLSDRKEHVNTLAALIEAQGVAAATLTGDMSTKARGTALKAIGSGRARVLCATGQLIGEGFDLPALSILFVATPVKFDGRVLQYLGRVLRPAPGKDRAVVFDYEDVNVGPLKASAKSRARVYERAH